MKFSEFFTSKENIQLDKKTLVILRWIAIVGQYITISIVYFYLKFELPFFYCSIVILIGALTNFYLQFKFNKNQLNNFTSTFLNLKSTINLSVITIIILIVLTINHLPLPHSGELHFHVPDIYLYAIPVAIIIGLVFLTYFGVRFGIESRKRT